MLGLLSLCAIHVPTYDGCASGCCTPPHVHTTSQVIYVRGTGGLEVHIDSLSKPFDIIGHEILDVDAVFKHEYDQSTYDLYIGCGGCVPDVDPIVTDPVPLDGYEHGEVEPFTQTAYRSVFAEAARKFNASLLHDCDQGHFAIRVVDYANRTDGSPLIWGAVIGLAEAFTFVELLAFPVFVLRNHGEWNDLGWTVYLTFLFAWLGWWLDRWLAKTLFGIKLLSPFDADMLGRPRAWLYDLAFVAFFWAVLEEFVHLCYAQANATFGYQFWVGFVGVILIGNGFPVLITAFTWWGMYHPEWAIASPWWVPLELASGLSYLFLFGAGFYVGPVAIVAASLVRAWEALRVREYVAVAQKSPGETGIPSLFF